MEGKKRKRKGTRNRKKRDELKKQKIEEDQFYAQKEIKRKWEILRQKNGNKPQKQKLIDEIMAMMKGNEVGYALKRDLSKVFQTILKYGTPEQKIALHQAFSKNYSKLCRDKFAKNIILKFIAYCDKEIINKIIKELSPKSLNLASHKVASEIIDMAYSKGNKEQKNVIISQIYGPHCNLLVTSENTDIESVLENHPEQKRLILSRLAHIIEMVIDKKMLHCTYLHRIIFDYIRLAPTEKVRPLLTSLHEDIFQIMHTREGAKVAFQAVTFATAKERKMIIKSCKVHFQAICEDDCACIVLIRILDVTDDTVLINKTLLKDLFEDKPKLQHILKNKSGRLLFLYILAPKNKNYFTDEVIDSLVPATVINPETKVEEAVSKKPPEIRRKELLKYIVSPLFSFFSDPAYLIESVCNMYAGQVYLELLNHLEDEKKQKLIQLLLSQVNNSDASILYNETCISTVIIPFCTQSPDFAKSFTSLISPFIADLLLLKRRPITKLCLYFLKENPLYKQMFVELLTPSIEKLKLLTENKGIEIIVATLTEQK